MHLIWQDPAVVVARQKILSCRDALSNFPKAVLKRADDSRPPEATDAIALEQAGRGL